MPTTRAKPASRYLDLLLRMRKGDVLLAGYSAMIIVLVIYAVQAHQIQARVSQDTSNIYEHHLQEEEALDACRRYFYAGGIYVRDFLLNPRPDRVATYRAEVAELKQDSQATLQEMEGLPGLKASAPLIHAKLNDLWDLIEQVENWSDEKRIAEGYTFIESEIVPRRNAAGELIREITRIRTAALKRKEEEFANSQDGATIQLFIILPVCLVLGYAASYFSLVRVRTLEEETARQHKELRQAKEDLEHLSARLLEIQEAERRRLSRELHDEVGQTLTALRIEISSAHSACGDRSPAVQERLGRARALAERTIKTVRDISILLRPAMLDDLGLGPALEWLVTDFSRRTGVPCHLYQEGLDGTLPDAYRTCVYRVVQQALHNCEAHAHAARVRLTVQKRPDEIVVEIEDNGAGFQAGPKGVPARSAGLGILGMRERATLLGGTLDVVSTPGKGTRVMLNLPLVQTLAMAAASGD